YEIFPCLELRRVLFRSYDLLLTPSTATPPPRVGQLGVAAPVRAAGKAALTLRLSALLHWTGVVEQQARNSLKYVPYTQLANLTRRPAMTVPPHWTGDGPPDRESGGWGKRVGGA